MRLRTYDASTRVVVGGCTVTVSSVNLGLVFFGVVTCSVSTVLVDDVEVHAQLSRTYRDGRKGFGILHAASGGSVVRVDEDDLTTLDSQQLNVVRLAPTDVEGLWHRCADVLNARPWTLLVGP